MSHTVEVGGPFSIHPRQCTIWKRISALKISRFEQRPKNCVHSVLVREPFDVRLLAHRRGVDSQNEEVVVFHRSVPVSDRCLYNVCTPVLILQATIRVGKRIFGVYLVQREAARDTEKHEVPVRQVETANPNIAWDCWNARGVSGDTSQEGHGCGRELRSESSRRNTVTANNDAAPKHGR